MIILDASTKTIEILSDKANLQWVSSWVGLSNICNGIPNEVNTELDGLTSVGTIIAVTAPSVNTNTTVYSNKIEYLSIHNTPNTGDAVITIQVNNNGNLRVLFKVTLHYNDFLIYNEDSGLQVFDSSGSVKTTSATISTNFATNEIPSGTINSSNTVFTLAHTPTTGSEEVYYQGQLQRPTSDYSISGNTITFVTAPDTGTSVYVSYRY